MEKINCIKYVSLYILIKIFYCLYILRYEREKDSYLIERREFQVRWK